MSTTRRILPDRPVDAYGSFSDDGGLTEQQFLANASMKEGVAGQAPLDSTFENTELEVVNRTRSMNRTPVPVPGEAE